jgi:hypothetical protein
MVKVELTSNWLVQKLKFRMLLINDWKLGSYWNFSHKKINQASKLTFTFLQRIIWELLKWTTS